LLETVDITVLICQ